MGGGVATAKTLRGLPRAGISAHQGLESKRRYGRLFAFLELLGGEGFVVVLAQRLEHGVLG